MAIWKNCRADIFYNNDKPDLNDPGYEVRIDDGEMVVSYENDDGWVNYKGKDLGGGHYLLTCPEVEGRAVLHRVPDSEIVEGNWSESGEHGMWRITLVEAVAASAAPPMPRPGLAG